MLVWETQGPLSAEMCWPSQNGGWFQHLKVTHFISFSPGLESGNIITSSVLLIKVVSVQRPTQIQREEAQTLHCFLQSVTSHYQPAGRRWKGDWGAWEYLHVQLGPQAFTVQDLE